MFFLQRQKVISIPTAEKKEMPFLQTGECGGAQHTGMRVRSNSTLLLKVKPTVPIDKCHVARYNGYYDTFTSENYYNSTEATLFSLIFKML